MRAGGAASRRRGAGRGRRRADRPHASTRAGWYPRGFAPLRHVQSRWPRAGASAGRRQWMGRWRAVVLGAGLAVLMCAGRRPRRSRPRLRRPRGDADTEGTRYHELLPDIGRIGAQVGAAIGPSWNPYEVGEGWQVAAFIDLPLARNRAGPPLVRDPARSQRRHERRVHDHRPSGLRGQPRARGQPRGRPGRPAARAVSCAPAGADAPAPARRVALRPQVHADRARPRPAAPLRHRRPRRLARHDGGGVPGRYAGSRPRGRGPLRRAAARRSWTRAGFPRAKAAWPSAATPGRGWRSACRAGSP